MHQGYRLNSRSGHIQESTNKCINKWNNKSVFLFLSLSLSISKINFKKKRCQGDSWMSGAQQKGQGWSHKSGSHQCVDAAVSHGAGKVTYGRCVFRKEKMAGETHSGLPTLTGRAQEMPARRTLRGSGPCERRKAITEKETI